jgi:thioredoxin 1
MKTAAQWTFEVNEHDFQAKVIEASRTRPILVDFWADWCAPCRAIAPILDRVIRELAGQVLLAKCEADENMRLAGHYKLRGFPTCILFVDGEPVAHFAGAKPEHIIREFIEEHSDAVSGHSSHGLALEE